MKNNDIPGISKETEHAERLGCLTPSSPGAVMIKCGFKQVLDGNTDLAGVGTAP